MAFHAGTLVDHLANAVSTALLLVTQSGERVWHNQALADLLCESPDETKQCDPATQLPLESARPGGPAVEVAWESSGATRWLKIQCREVADHVLYEIVDITKRRAERERAQGHQWRLSHIERLAKIGTWEWDPATGTLLWSAELLASLGFPPDADLDFAAYRELLHPEDVALVDRTLRDALRTGRPFSYTHRIYLADLVTLRHFECYGEIIFDDAGAPAKVLCVAHDITERQRFQAELTYLADHDPLTGLVNRRVVTARLADLIARDHDGGGLLIVDIDNFKDVNDLRGHAVGDEVMRCLARLLREHLPPSAVLGRLGGDEFAVVLFDGGTTDVLRAGEILCDQVARTPLVVFGETLRITLSVGAAPLCGDHDSEILMAHADLALYEAKNAGRNRARLFALEQYRHAVQRVNVVRRIREALDTNHLELDAQPIVDLAEGRTTSYELLVRLRDGVYPEIGPSEFLPTLERGDLVRELDRWVILQAVDALSLPAARGEGLCLDVNVSSRSMDDPGFGDWVVETLRKFDVSPPRLGLEITETTAISNLDAARRLAATLTAAGCRFSLDDFGAGFGSFTYLKHLPFTTVKISGEFVRQADQRGADRVLVDAVVRAATGLGMTTVAEYVDRAPLVNALHQLGVNRGQGFYLGEPSPLRALVAAGKAETSPARTVIPRPR